MDADEVGAFHRSLDEWMPERDVRQAYAELVGLNALDAAALARLAARFRVTPCLMAFRLGTLFRLQKSF